MANTVIQLKWSDVTSAPTSLNVGEAAYSNTSQRLYIGDTSNNVLTIGGKFFVDQQGLIFTKTNVAFDTANSAASYANAAFASSNNNAGVAAAGSYANSAFGTANSAASYANSAFGTANTADAKGTSAGSYANSAFATANNEAGVNATQNTNISSAASYANSAFAAANTADAKGTSAGSYANSAFATANTKYSSSGGTIAGDVSITGNLNVTGNVVSISTSQIVANDSLIILAAGNYTTDILDIGFAGHYNDGSNAHTGIIRDAGTKEYHLFEGYTPEISANNNIDINDPSFKIATLNANVHSTKVLIKGIDLLPYVNNAYTAANTADSKAVSAGSYANTAFSTANTADSTATSAASYANSAFGTANTADSKAVSAGSYANSGFAVANSAASYANAAFSTANSAFAEADSAASYANSAFAKANTDFTNISITGADYGTASSVPAFRVEANGRISSANSTAIAIAASAITSGTLGVARGGTGAATFTTNGVLLGQGTSAFTTASSSTEGHLLTINASGVPTFSHLQGGTF
jgi:hypothetical protein